MRKSVATALRQREAIRTITTGRQLASLIEVVVNAANNGTLSKVPSMWTNFLKLQIEEAKPSSQSLQHSRLIPYDLAVKPLDTESYAEKVNVSTNAAVELYDKILVGFNFGSVSAGRTTLINRLSVQGQGKAAINQERVREYLRLLAL